MNENGMNEIDRRVELGLLMDFYGPLLSERIAEIMSMYVLEDYGLSEIAHQFIAGICKHVKSISAITNPLVNSYKRLVPGYEAPCYIAWTTCNRSALIRVPDTRGVGTRVELRSPDPACNPYLVVAACLAAGLDGIDKKLDAKKEPVNLPENLAQAADYSLRREENRTER